MITLSDEKNAKDKVATNNNGEISYASDSQNVVADESQSGAQVEKPASAEADDDVTDGSRSPGTLALMCNENDTDFRNSISNGVGDRNADSYGHLPNGQVITETYVEQEKTVLTTFRDCLNKLITFGELKGKFLTLPFGNQFMFNCLYGCEF